MRFLVQAWLCATGLVAAAAVPPTDNVVSPSLKDGIKELIQYSECLLAEESICNPPEYFTKMYPRTKDAIGHLILDGALAMSKEN